MRPTAIVLTVLVCFGCKPDEQGPPPGGTDTSDSALPTTGTLSTGTVTGDACGPATFDLRPAGGGPKRSVKVEMCFHAASSVGDCPIHNYDLGTLGDWDDYLDMYWGAQCGTPSMDAAFQSGGESFQLSGTPTGAPPQQPTPAGQPAAVFATGTWSSDALESGTFDALW